MSLTFTLALANVRHDMTRPQKADDIATFSRMLSGDWIAAGCEIDNPDSRYLWHTEMPAGLHFGNGTETPVVVSHGWDVIGHQVLTRTTGEAGFDPARKTVLLRLRHHATGIRVAVLATHMDHWAFNGPALGRVARLAKWDRHLSLDRRTILRLRLAGYVVAAVGDLNSGRVVEYGRGQKAIHPHGVMQMTVLPPLRPGVRVRLGHLVTRTGHTDHPLLAVSVGITRD